MADYDIGQAFAEIEDELISSMIRNLSHHRAEETKEGYKWSQWQVEQLKALEEYKAINKEKFTEKFSKINENIETAISEAYKQGEMEQEIKILEAIKNGYKPPTVRKSDNARTTGEFFKVNERKLNSLIKSTTNDMKKAEQAVLRRANDHYRKIIYNAQVYANAGGTTYEKAVDMATRDFLRAGIDSIEYSNGARHTISDYADMAIKTATKRAYLRGEGTKREEWGIHTVITNKRGNPCPLCVSWVGMVLIDDVYSGGTEKESNDTGYPLVSEAMDEGFLHPRCQDAFTTYFEGISTPPEQEQITEDEEQEIKENNDLKQKQQYHERMAEKCHRIADNSLDKDNQKTYSARAEEHSQKAAEIADKISDESVEKSAESGIIKYSYSSSVKKQFKPVFDEEYKLMAEKFGRISTIKHIEPLVDNDKSVFGMFNDNSRTISIRFADRKDGLSMLSQETIKKHKSGKWSSSHSRHVIRHEIGHAIQLEHKLYDSFWNDKLSKIITVFHNIDETQTSKYGMLSVSEFISECIAESMTKKARGISKQIVNIIKGVE